MCGRHLWHCSGFSFSVIVEIADWSISRSESENDAAALRVDITSFIQQEVKMAGNPDLVNLPDADRLITGLRDTGYEFTTAAADIVDNSIAANATTVSIDLELMSDGRKFVYFADDGDGMNDVQLFKAMRYGAEQRENLASLGKFGLGLKTASSSICKKFTVISRQSALDELAKLAWDLDHVSKINEWEMLKETVTDEEAEKFDELIGGKGTLVIWSKCDRLLGKIFQDPGGTQEKAAMTRLNNKLKKHVGLVYHRFLDFDDSRIHNVAIYVNGEKVVPWNPFFPQRSEQVLVAEQQEIEIELPDGGDTKAKVKAWILPHQKDCNAEEKELAQHSNKAQGFYIFREGRLIDSGGWAGIWGAPEPHMSLLRIEFDFDHSLDEAFHVDVKKSSIRFDPGLEEYLLELLNPVRREAERRYRRKSKQVLGERGIDHASSNISVQSTPNVAKPTVTEVDESTKTVVVTNKNGPSIRLKTPVEKASSPESLHIEAVDSFTDGGLWEPVFRSSADQLASVGVKINKLHDFYQKIYQRASSSGYSVQGMDLLLWAFCAAEQNHSNPELEEIFEDLRLEVASNLRKLLKDVEIPEGRELDS